MDALSALAQTAEKAIHSAQDLAQLDAIRVKYLGKKGQLTQALRTLGQLPLTERACLGKLANQTKTQLTGLIREKQDLLKQAVLAQALSAATIDVTLPGRVTCSVGRLHPVKRVQRRLERLFVAMGFEVFDGPEIEDDFHNFTALNISKYHPARAMHDTFYLPGGLLLRTHTSPVQIRAMKNRQPPMRLVVPGRVYRCDSDPTHSPMFHQLEGLVLDEQATFVDLRSLLEQCLKSFFSNNCQLRFRPSYFPFTEPSAEVDIQCLMCHGKGCQGCKKTGWLEVLGCGMVHPNVLSHVGIDSERYTGFAFGMGIDRLAMLLYGVNDLRLFFDNHLDFLNQF